MNEDIVCNVLRCIPLAERHGVARNVADALPLLKKCTSSVMANIEDFLYSYDSVAVHQMWRIWPRTIMKKRGVSMPFGEFCEWSVVRKNAINDVPISYINRVNILTNLQVHEDEVSFAIRSTPATDALYHTLPGWHEASKAAANVYYGLTLCQTFANDYEEFDIHLIFAQTSALIDGKFNMRLTLKAQGIESYDGEYIMEGERSWAFAYDSLSKSIEWKLPLNESSIMFPPPRNTFMHSSVPAPFAASFAQYDCHPEGLSIKHCDPQDCELEHYQLDLSIDDINRFLLGKA